MKTRNHILLDIGIKALALGIMMGGMAMPARADVCKV